MLGAPGSPPLAKAEADAAPATGGDPGAPSIQTDIIQGAAPQEPRQIAMARPVRLEIPTTAEVVTPGEAVEVIRERPGSAVASNVQTDVAAITNSGVNVATNTARPRPPVGGGGISMAAPVPEAEESGIAIASVDTSPARTPARPGVPSALSPSAAPQVDAPSINTASAETPVKETAPDAQTLVAEAPEAAPQPEAPENSGVLASLARSSSFLGVTVSAAKALLSPDEEQTVAAVSPSNTTSAPRPKDFSVDAGLSAQVPDISELERATSVPQADRPVVTGGSAPALVASLRTDDTSALSGLSTPAARPEPTPPPAAEVPPVATPEPVEPVIAEENVPEQEVAALTPPEAEEEAVPAAPEPPVALDCGIDMALQAQVGAEVVASILSPCRPDTQFEVTHAGLAFSATTDAEGMANVVIPALTDDVDVKISFEDGAEAEGSIAVTDLRKVTRVAVTWDADIDFDLHALEFGAQVGADGHVWVGAPGDYRSARRGGGGYMMSLGPLTGPGLRAEVYTLFQTSRTKEGFVDLSLKLAGFGAECDDAPVIRTLRTEGEGIERDRDITFSLSGCENAADIVVPNTIRDIRISRR
ncbi:MAG: hypothetical protein AAFY59_05320 [Pseudomonadota bacterium]